MKTLAIVVLLLLLLVGLFLTCPSPNSFDDYYKAKIAPTEPKPLFFFAHTGEWKYHYKNCYLIATEEKDEKIVYIGVFGHWFAG